MPRLIRCSLCLLGVFALGCNRTRATSHSDYQSEFAGPLADLFLCKKTVTSSDLASWIERHGGDRCREQVACSLRFNLKLIASLEMHGDERRIVLYLKNESDQRPCIVDHRGLSVGCTTGYLCETSPPLFTRSHVDGGFEEMTPAAEFPIADLELVAPRGFLRIFSMRAHERVSCRQVFRVTYSGPRYPVVAALQVSGIPVEDIGTDTFAEVSLLSETNNASSPFLTLSKATATIVATIAWDFSSDVTQWKLWWARMDESGSVTRVGTVPIDAFGGNCAPHVLQVTLHSEGNTSGHWAIGLDRLTFTSGGSDCRLMDQRVVLSK